MSVAKATSSENLLLLNDLKTINQIINFIMANFTNSQKLHNMDADFA